MQDGLREIGRAAPREQAVALLFGASRLFGLFQPEAMAACGVRSPRAPQLSLFDC
jgi:hypothetical protein